MKEKMKLLQRISGFFKSGAMSKIAMFVVAWIIAFDIVAGTFIPIAYGKGCGWFAIPNLIIDICVIIVFLRRINDAYTH